MLKTLYNSRTGGYVLKLITRPGFSRRCAGLLDSGYSRIYIKRFIRQNDIDMSDYICEHWKSFNDFFIRKIKPGARPVDMDENALVCPCDSVLSSYRITKDSVFTVKNAPYTLTTLLNDENLAREYSDGLCLIFRMMPVNYHRYIYPDWGSKGENIPIAGCLHTVRPVAQDKYQVYVTNSREYTVLNTRNFGEMVFMEVGAMMVGRIRNHHQACEFAKGEEKGYFEYGGSTIILLLKKDRAVLDEAFLSAMDTGREIPVQVGQRIGAKTHA